MDVLSVLDVSVGRTYALTDPHPPTAREVVDVLRTARQAGGVGAAAPAPDARAHRPGARHGAAARPACRGRRLLRLADDVLHHATRRPTSRAPGCSCPPFTSTPTAWSTSCAPMPRSARRRWSEPPAPKENPRTSPDHTPDLTVVNVSLTGPERDYDTVSRSWTAPSGSCASGPPATSTPPAAWCAPGRAAADAIAVTGVREARAVGLYDGELDAIDSIKPARTTEVPVSDGHALGDVLQEWAIRHLQTELPGYLANARTVVLGGLNHARTTRLLREFTDNIEFADPLLRFDLPAKVAGDPLLGLAGDATALWPMHQLPGVVKSKIQAPGSGSAPRWPARPPGRRRRGGDVRRADRLRPGGPRRQDPDQLRDLRGAARPSWAAAASTWCWTASPQPFAVTVSPRPCSRR